MAYIEWIYSDNTKHQTNIIVMYLSKLYYDMQYQKPIRSPLTERSSDLLATSEKCNNIPAEEIMQNQ